MLERGGDDILNFAELQLTLTTEQSKRINDITPPKIIMAGAGMSNGGRILHHEVRYLPDPRSTILFVGYQATGSLGRKILEGAPEVSIFGETVPVRCKKVNIPGFSAHADQPHLLAWLCFARSSRSKKFSWCRAKKRRARSWRRKIRDDLRSRRKCRNWAKW